jgi:taurine dioxygenase
MSRVDDYPRSIHPMVCVQEETGRKVLNVSPWFAVAIQGREHDEGDALLRAVIECLESEDHAYYHQWQAGDMVLWDNWRMLHRATGLPPHLPRWLQRTTIFGDYGLGALESDAAEDLAHISV